MNIEQQELAKVAIDFYTDLIRNPKYGDKENSLEGLASLIATHVKLSTKKDADEEQIKLFEKSLTENIAKRIERGAKMIEIESDWYPEGILAQACIDSEINPQFPSRFGLTIDLQKMEVRKAYFGHDSEIIFKK
jgi:hypothetical protein